MELQENNMAGIKPGETFESLMIDFRKNEKKAGLINATGKLNETGTSLFGSGIGLEIIEPPLLVPGESTILQEGMVLSVFVGEATANGRPVGPRDVVLVTKNGSRKITRIPSQVFFP
jgi:Xaa-Pro aminopeptidase